MNHLKKYKLFESAELLDPGEIKDILLELTDIGYVIFVQTGWWSDDHHGSIRIVLKGRPKVYNKVNPSGLLIFETKNIIVFNEILETALRLVVYFKGFEYYPSSETIKFIEFMKEYPERVSIVDEYSLAFTS